MELVPIKVADIPAFGDAENPTFKAIKEFLESDAEAVEIIDPNYGMASTASRFRGVLSRVSLPCKIMQRQKRLFLVRTEKEGGADK